jgi:nucleoside-diphosphate-sugar epimerase
MRANVFITGGTGYIGRRHIPPHIARGHRVRALVRPGSELRVPMGATPIIGDIFDRSTYGWSIGEDSVVIHLVGTPRPSPLKAKEFERVDLPAARECIDAAREGRAKHFVYVSVAQPAPTMHAYVSERARVEA